jgi:hypothetical protein
MKEILVSVLCITAACAPAVYTSSAGGDVALGAAPSSADMATAYGTTLPLDTRLMYVDRYVDVVEDRIARTSERPLTLVQTPLEPRAFSDLAEMQFQRMDAYWDGAVLKRIRMIPLPPETATEEFYFNDGNLVYVYYERDAASKPDPHEEIAGQKFYFGSEGLINWELENGTRVSRDNPDFAKWSSQLLKEAERFARGPR